MGLLSIPYAMRQAGWVGLALLYSLGAIACYTGTPLRFHSQHMALFVRQATGWSAFGRFMSIVKCKLQPRASGD